jgi:squalene-hopene/tetraprenyl-beta-curcumene cyclase
VLDGLGRVALTTSAPAVRRAIEFLRAQQFDHGGFWDRWTVNYLASTACGLQGLTRVSADMSEPWVRRAVDFVLSRPNGDGGWGELPDSYRDPALAGRGPSMPPLTGLVLPGRGARPLARDRVRRSVRQALPRGHSSATSDAETGACRGVPLPVGQDGVLAEEQPGRRRDRVARAWPPGGHRLLDRPRHRLGAGGKVDPDRAQSSAC